MQFQGIQQQEYLSHWHLCYLVILSVSFSLFGYQVAYCSPLSFSASLSSAYSQFGYAIISCGLSLSASFCNWLGFTSGICLESYYPRLLAGQIHLKGAVY